MKSITVSLLLIIVLCSCNRLPKDVRMVLKAAGENRAELEKVIDHYKNSGDKEKLMAAYFLIGNMDNKFTIECKEKDKYDPIFNVFDSLKKTNQPPYSYPFHLTAKWDTLVKINGPPSFRDAKIIPDYMVMKADYLIDNIDMSFKLREESMWGKKINFNNFCEYVLAYRFNHEPLENWRSYYYEKYKTKLDSINADSCYQLAKAINQIIPKARWYSLFMTYPYDIQNSKMVKGLIGACPHIVIYNATSMRSLGLPVGIDYSSLWGNHRTGHKWNVLFMENDKPWHFERKKDTLSVDFVWRKAKIFRETFGRQTTDINDAREDVPDYLLNNHRIDVTHEYTKTSNINVPLRYPPVSKKKYAVICTFNNKNWIPQDWGKIIKGKAFFKNMGTAIVYLTMYYINDELYPASDPFFLSDEGIMEYLVPLKTNAQDMLLLRKFLVRKHPYDDNMINGYFQGANNADFSDSVKIYTITAMPVKIETAKINNSLKFRYVRYKSPPPGKGNVAELEFYGGTKSSDTLLLHGKVIGFPEVPTIIGTPYQNVFDGNPETFFNRPGVGLCWAGLDLGTPKRITKISYCPRSDSNFILVGDTYELCYWDDGKWVSMGEQVAIDQFLIYKNVPEGALYLLHNLTRGSEERIFTYENGKQVWW